MISPDQNAQHVVRDGVEYKAPFVVSIDIGSSSVRGAVYDALARTIPGTERRSGHPLHTSADGAAVEYADHLIAHVESVMDGVAQAARDVGAAISAVGMDSMASTVLGTDSEGRAVTPIYSYADTQPAKHVRKLDSLFDTRAAYQRTATPPHTSYLPARLVWLRDTDPDVFSKARKWMDIGTFMYWRWFGDADLPMSYAMASWMGILDRHKLEYDAEVLDSIGVLRSAFQPLACYQHRMCGLMGEFASRWPSFRDVPFLLNMGDGACANIGSGCVGAGKMALTVGTSGAIRTLLDGDPETIPQGLWAYKVGTKRALLGASFTDGGNVFAWCTDTLRLPEGNGIESALAASTPDGHGLTVLPFFSGERSPGWVASARATLHGLNIATTPVEITQALLEAVAFRFSAAYSVIEPHLGASHQIIASGGAITSSPYWLQTMANVLQRRIDTVTEQELTSRGTAILALNAIGAWDRLDDVPPTMGRSYIPNTETASVYREAMQRQQRLYGLLIRDGEAMI